jgi:hypothetical protein
MAAVSMAECSLEVVGKAEVYFIAHYAHPDPTPAENEYYSMTKWHNKDMFQCKNCSFSTLDEDEMMRHIVRHTDRNIVRREGGGFVSDYGERLQLGGPFTYRSPRYQLEDEVATLTDDWFPVAYHWIVREKNSDEFTVLKTCGDVPHPCLCVPWDGLVTDPEECTVEAPKKSEVYLMGYYLHEDPEIPQIRYTYKSRITKHKKETTLSIDWQGYPVAVEWFIKPDGLDEFQPALVCGEIPVD